MADAFIVRRGGGGGTKLFAAIGVKFSAGSTLTCTCVETGKVFNAKTTSDQTEYVFAVPNAGTWTVADVTRGKAKDVPITKPGQFESISLAELYVFQRNVGFADGFSGKYLSYGGGQNFIKDLTDTDSIKVPQEGFNTIMIQEPIDESLGQYSKVNMTLKQTYGSIGMTFGVINTLRTQTFLEGGTFGNEGQVQVTADVSKNNSLITISAPLDNVKAPAYLAANVCHSRGEIYDIWLD